jgi:diguanylate cyclase (GGDEF)-like protein
MVISLKDFEQRLEKAATPRDEIDALNELAWELRHSQPARSIELSQRAYALSASGEFAGEPYRQGQASSLTTQGFLNRHAGKFDLALSQCSEAVALLEAEPPGRVLIDSLRMIGWVHFFLGDIPLALSYDLKALRLAHELDLKVQEASVLDGLGVIYVASGDIQQALRSHEEAVRIARDSGDKALETAVYNNYSMTLVELGKLSEALDFGIKSLDIARQSSNGDQEISSLDSIGQVLLKMGDYARAEQYMSEGLDKALQAGSQLGQVYCLMGLGKISLAQDILSKAELYFLHVLEIAVELGVQSLCSDSHLFLTDIYARQGDYNKALEHHKLFYDIHEKTDTDASAKRLAVLKVVHQLETAQRDAEIYRLRNVELQREIEERARIEAELEKLATLDPLTNAFNRRHFFELARRDFERAVRYNRPFTLLMIDVDHFKAINDTYGHLIGDQALGLLAIFLQSSLRRSDVLGRYGGDEFCAILPETGLEQAKQTAMRIINNLRAHRFETSAGKVALSISVGVASLPEGDWKSRGSLDNLLDLADQALYEAKRAGRNQVAAVAFHL